MKYTGLNKFIDSKTFKRKSSHFTHLIVKHIRRSSSFFFSFAYTTSPAAVTKLVVFFRSSKPPNNFWWSGVSEGQCAIRSGWCLLHLWRTCSVVWSSSPQGHVGEGTIVSFLCMCALSLLWPNRSRAKTTKRLWMLNAWNTCKTCTTMDTSGFYDYPDNKQSNSRRWYCINMVKEAYCKIKLNSIFLMKRVRVAVLLITRYASTLYFVV